jgi:hypothetical protein
MSRHVPRSDRWSSHGTGEHRSAEGPVVRRFKGEWWAEVAYLLLTETEPGEPATWESHSERLGPFRRPRNAMVEAERHAVLLRNRHGDRVRLVSPDSVVAPDRGVI